MCKFTLQTQSSADITRQDCEPIFTAGGLNIKGVEFVVAATKRHFAPPTRARCGNKFAWHLIADRDRKLLKILSCCIAVYDIAGEVGDDAWVL
ncbi:unannotated protein [freshwater metagenome]|uniref:Unannotated protein n=1 Tax=freshwater metagenome TaxID=449393 RepID=A0A6J6G653_9ZZZZ